MCADIVVPSLGESVSEATIAKWYKKVGDAVKKDEPLVELETDKVTMEVNAPEEGVLEALSANEGDTVNVGAVLGSIKAGATAAASVPAKPEATASAPSPAPAVSAQPQPVAVSSKDGPAVTKMLAENPQVNRDALTVSGKDGRATKGDVITAISGGAVAGGTAVIEAPKARGAREERVKMSKLRQVIAKRLKDSQNTAAILTTFNEIDMSNVIELRAQYKDDFEKKFGIKLGFMGFFVKAAVAALKEIPEVNAQIDGADVIYKNYYDIGVAVGTEQGLVVPVVRDADVKSLSEIEADIAHKAQAGTAGNARHE